MILSRDDVIDGSSRKRKGKADGVWILPTRGRDRKTGTHRSGNQCSTQNPMVHGSAL
jgi:hypothetical protein